MAQLSDDREEGEPIVDYMLQLLCRDGETASLKLHSGHMKDLLSYIPITDDLHSDESVKSDGYFYCKLKKCLLSTVMKHHR